MSLGTEIGWAITSVTLVFLGVLCVIAYSLGRRDGHPDVYVGMGFLLATCIVGMVIYLWR